MASVFRLIELHFNDWREDVDDLNNIIEKSVRSVYATKLYTVGCRTFLSGTFWQVPILFSQVNYWFVHYYFLIGLLKLLGVTVVTHYLFYVVAPQCV